jgi:hypothetical protein
MTCNECPEKETCRLLGSEFKCPRAPGREVPFSILGDNFLDRTEISTDIFCSSPDHFFKREIRAHVALSDLTVKEILAVHALASTDYPFSILEVSEALGISKARLYYLRSKIKI